MATLIPTATPVRIDHESTLNVAPPSCAECSEWCRYFEDLYHDAAGDAGRIPWSDNRPNAVLQAWLNSEAPSLIRPGATACVVGCGLGEDTKELNERGYDVLGFDVSSTAVQWARRRHPAIPDRFVVADLFRLPPSLPRRWDLVVEINTLQAIHPDLRPAAAAGIASLARPRGVVLTICRGRDEHDPLPPLPPFALSQRELTDLFAPHGLLPLRAADDFLDDQSPPVRRLRCAFKRG